MDPSTPVNYWSQESLSELIRGVGFRVYHHAMIDILPYPHVIYICEKNSSVTS